MGKKFIDKKKCRHRKVSTSDSITDELARVNLIDYPSEPEDGQTDPSCCLKEARRYGIEFNDADEYDYLQHMMPIVPDAGFFDNPNYLLKLKEEDVEQKSNQDVIEILRELDCFDSVDKNDHRPAQTANCEVVLSQLLRATKEHDDDPLASNLEDLEPFPSSSVNEDEFNKVPRLEQI
ncbi:hypothetical protein MDAP_001329 [Mitosporidium daphniae]